MTRQMRLPSVPLITCDPYFSIWSPYDILNGGDTAHWCGKKKPIRGYLCIDGVYYCFMGDPTNHTVIPQTGLTVTALSTEYQFENQLASLKVQFTSPLLLDRPELVSRPCTYIDVEVLSRDGKDHEMKVIITFSETLTHENAGPEPLFGGKSETQGFSYAWFGKQKQTPLGHSGDNITIDWGYLYLALPSGQDGKVSVSGTEQERLLTAEIRLHPVKGKSSGYLVAAYDDIASINYFGETKRAYWTSCYESILDAIGASVSEHYELLEQCAAYDSTLYDRAVESAGEKYADLCAASYRHSISAHKLIADNDGNLIFLSKENDSNGCIGTVDVTYPSVPLYLLHGTEYVKGMLRPVLRFAGCDSWEYDFAPHDVGRYPYATGQVYGLHADNCGIIDKASLPREHVFPFYSQFPQGSDIYDLKYQMPVEECGNMLILMAVVAKLDGNADFSAPHFELLKQWVQYLERYGADPGEQLCTDDFAGHLAHNINLSAKAILGIQGFSMLCGMLGKEDMAQQYAQSAKKMAESWQQRAANSDATALTFDKPDSWSLKYNLVWDRFLQSGLFDDTVYEKEISCYLKQANAYGVPLDSRCSDTKSDWILWSTALTDNKEERQKLIEPVWNYLRETASRVPFSDWYDTETGTYRSFIARSVQGGIFMPIFFDLLRSK